MSGEDKLDLGRGAILRYWPAFLDPADADRALAEVLAEISWTQGEVKIAGKVYAEPRLTAWMGDPGARYTYTGRPLEPAPWSPRVALLRAAIENASGARFNSVLANRYRDGADSMGLHADDEPELGPAPVIASLSLGAVRRFVMKPRPARGEKKAVGEGFELDLAHGSLLVMEGETQRAFKHGVPKRAGAIGERVNLTFRKILIAG